jgi:hypothetical protein
VCEHLSSLFGAEAMCLAKEAGLRNRQWNGATLLRLLVFGWLAQPQAGISQLVRIANSMGIRTSKQALDAHFTERTAQWLLLVLQEAVRKMVSGPQVNLPLLQRFAGVFIEDGSTISLPVALGGIWKGNGGNREGKQGPQNPGTPIVRKQPKTEAAVKLTVRWDLLQGSLHGPHLQAGRHQELRSVLREEQMPKGSLWIGDQGYFALIWLAQLAMQGVFFLIRYKSGTTIWVNNRRLTDVRELLPEQEQEEVDLPVMVGASKQVQARLLARRVPEAVAEQRRAKLHTAARKSQQPCSEYTLALCQWTLFLTNVPVGQLSLPEAFALARARWQIELLFKLWKEMGLVDEWSSKKPWQVLCELYAKLIAMVVQHWLLIQGCWDDPHHSLVQASGVIRERSAVLLGALSGHLSLRRAVKVTIEGIRAACPIPSRSTRLSTAHLLLGEPFWGLT